MHSHPGALRPEPPPAASLFPPGGQGIAADLRHGLGARRPLAPRPAQQAQEPRVGQLVAGRFTILARVRGLGSATLYRAADAERTREVLLLVEPRGVTGAGGEPPELRRSDLFEHPNLLPQLDVGRWAGLRLASFVAPRGEPLANMALPLGGRLPPLHVATLAAGAVSGLAALHDAGRLLGGVFPGSLIVSPWGLDLRLVGWGRAGDPRRAAERAGHELRALGKVLLRLRGTRGDHPAEVELDDLLRLVASSDALGEGMPTVLVAQALSRSAEALAHD